MNGIGRGSSDWLYQGPIPYLSDRRPARGDVFHLTFWLGDALTVNPSAVAGLGHSFAGRVVSQELCLIPCISVIKIYCIVKRL